METTICSSTEEWRKKLCVCVCVSTYLYQYIMEYHSAIKKNETMPFAAIWMDLEIILSEVRQRKINIITDTWDLKNK